MTGHVRVKYLNAPNGSFSTNSEYDVLGFVLSSNLEAVIVDDNGGLARADLGSGAFSVVEAYAVQKVI